MASQINATVYKKNNSLVSPAVSLAFLTANSFIQHNTSVTSALSVIEYNGDIYFVSQAVSTLVTAANVDGTSMVQATLIQEDALPVLPVTKQIAVPVIGITIYPYVSGSVNSIITYNGHQYFVAETQAVLVAAANVGSSSSGTVTSVSVTTANGVSGSVATATTTPAITLTLGAITPTTIVASGAISGSNLSGTNTGDNTFSTGLTNTAGTITANLSTGKAGSQSVIGGTAASETLTLSSTAHATKGKVIFGTSGYDEVNNRLGISTTSPSFPLHVKDDGGGVSGVSPTTACNLLVVNGAETKGTYFGYLAFENLSAFVSAGVSGGFSFISYNGTAWGERLRIHTNGLIGVGSVAAPTAFLHLPPSIAGSASFNLGNAGTAPTSPVNGDMWIESNTIKARLNGATVTVATL